MFIRDVRVVALGLVAAGALLVAACGDDDGAGVREIDAGQGSGSGSGSGSASGSGSHASGSHSASGAACAEVEEGHERIEFTLDDFSIDGPSEVAAGEVFFEATNEGEHAHEIVVVKGVAPADLPIADGAVDETALPDGALLGEIEAFPPGDTCAGEFTLEAGDYTLFCNVVEEDGTGHVEEGMVTRLTAT